MNPSDVAQDDAMRALIDDATRASAMLKSLANPHRLIIMCLLSDSEKNVGELEIALGIRQPTLSQQLARLRQDGLVASRRSGKEIHYRIANEDARALMRGVYEVFCKGRRP